MHETSFESSGTGEEWTRRGASMSATEQDQKNLNRLSGRVLGAAFAVHSALGPGLLESAYEACLAYELEYRGLQFERQKALPVRYHGRLLADVGYRLDLLIEDQLVVEVKSIDAVRPIHHAQLLTYLRLSGLHLGLLLNFNVKLLKRGGIHRRVLNLREN